MINVIAELERYGVKFEFGGPDEVKVTCPFHDDHSPSCAINTQKRVFRCCTAGCKAKGDFIGFLAGQLKTTRQLIRKELSSRYDLSSDKTVDAQLIERYHAAIWQAGPLLQELYARGVTDADIRQYRLGVNNGRITIPIKNAAGMFVNIRSYLPGAPGADKFRNLKGRGGARLFPIEQLAYKKILVVGGEIKAIVAARILNQHGIGVVTSTLGESNWEPKLTASFSEADMVAVCYDIDEEGVRSQENTCMHLKQVTQVRSAVLPLDRARFPKGDINDFVVTGGDLLAVFMDAPKFAPTVKPHLRQEKPKKVSLSHAMTASCAGKRILVTGVVSTLDMSPYVIPKSLKIICSKDQEVCSNCPVYLKADGEPFEIHPESPAILDMVGRPKLAQQMAIMEDIGIPKKCGVWAPEAVTFYNVEDVRISPELEMTDRALDRSMQPAICIGTGVELNETYELIGRMHPHPATQQSTLLISKYRPAQDALSNFKVKHANHLLSFRPKEWTLDLLKVKLDEVYLDLENNVTRVWGRRNLHLFVDLAYHSPLLVEFEDKTIKGWTEILIVGDSAQGKSETAMTLQNHYGLGVKVECKNATVAGLLGGLQQLGARWFVSWGVIPTQDRRLVILEELKGTSVEVISKLTDMRSSGIAEIPKIERRRTHARTRLLAISNPRDDHPVGHHNFGISAIKQLIGNPEDIRRFDACLIVAAADANEKLINMAQESRERIPHRFHSDLCKNLVLWGWTTPRTILEPEAKDRILQAASDLSAEFSDAIPIVDRGSMRYKLARLAAALAVRTYSADQDNNCIVRLCHVEFIVELLRNTYNSPSFGYKEFTQSVRTQETIRDPEILRAAIINTPFPKDFVHSLMSKIVIELQDIQDWCGWDRTLAQSLISTLVRKHAIERRGRAYIKTSPFINWLKTLDVPERPAHIPENAGPDF